MSYFESFVIPVPTKNIGKYRRMSKLMKKVWIAHGALEYKEFVGDDIKPGKVTSFPQSVNLKNGEMMVVGWVSYTSKAHRDRVTKNAMKDQRLGPIMDPKAMPFDGIRMFMGGFKPLSGR
jgi:uncharacterized protein YbaA (DUF1428 family)